MTGPIHIISLGAGVQSSTMSLMAACGEITPMPKCAIFADTQAEPKSVYVWLDWLEKQLPFPLHRVTQGSLEADTLRIRQRKDKKGFWNPSGIPAYIQNVRRRIICQYCATPVEKLTSTCPECRAIDCGKLVEEMSRGIGPRQCTHDFKIIPIQRHTRKILKENGVKLAVKWIGISLDEISRMKESRTKYEQNRWPLVDLGMNRHDCLRWMEARKFPTPPRSACVFCPFHSDLEWKRLKEEEPDGFNRAVAFEKEYQRLKGMTTLMGKPYLHDSLKPLSEVDFSTEEERGQLNMFNNECEGMCGV